MSRIGKQPIKLPQNVTVAIKGRDIFISGPQGELQHHLPVEISAVLEDGWLKVSPTSDTRRAKEQYGLQRQLLANMAQGVSEGYEKKLELQGMGYRVKLQGTTLVFSLGFSHPVEVSAPEGINFKVEGQNKISVSGIDKQLVGEVAAKIRFLRPPEPYKGKGIRYEGEYVRRKAGKSGKVGG